MKYEFDNIGEVIKFFHKKSADAQEHAMAISKQMMGSKSVTERLALQSARAEAVTWTQAANIMEDAVIKSLDK